MTRLVQSGDLRASPIIDECAAVSVGLIDGVALLDLPYAEDSGADVDFNVVMTGSGELIEVQGTAEGRPFRPVRNSTTCSTWPPKASPRSSPPSAPSCPTRPRRDDCPVGPRRRQRAAPAETRPVDGPTAMIELVCASANPDKVAEMAEVLAGRAVLLPRPPGMGEVIRGC